MANYTLIVKLVDSPNKVNTDVFISNSENMEAENFRDALDYLVSHLMKDRNELIRKFIQKEVQRG